MKTVVEDAGTCRKKLRIEVPAEKVKSTFADVVSVYARSAKLKGFRPGKAPRQLVERKFSKEIADDVKERLIPESYQEALKKESLDVLSVLDMGEVSFDLEKPMSFSVTLDVKPEFKLPKYRGLRVKKEKPEVTDAEVDEAIESVRQQYATYEDVEDRPVQRGDMAQVDYEGLLDGQPIEALGEAVKGLGERKDFWVMVDENAFLPGFAEGLTGMKPGERKQIFVDFGADFPVKELAGKQGAYFVQVKAVREKNLPEADDEFAKQLKMESMDNLRAQVREDLVRMAGDRVRARQRSELLEQLSSKTKFDLPESIVARETQSMVEEIVRNQTARGASREDITGQQDEIMETAGRHARDRVRIRFILDAIADQENVAVSDEDLNNHLRSMAARYGMEASAFRQELMKRDALEDMQQELRRQRVVDFLLEQADIKE